MTRMSRHFPQTKRHIATDRELTPGHDLLERAGFVRPSGAAGIFTLLPLGFETHRRITDVIYEEMTREGVQNLQLPILQPRELWERTNRWDGYVADKILFQTREAHRGTDFALAPTAEEMVTALAAAEVRSFRELPLRLHQIGWKFRDEIRPRFGLLRCREFSMSDAYSFDRDQEGMHVSFDLFRTIYERIFTRLGLTNVISVQADSGAIGGDGSAEFMAVSDVGEDVLLTCGRCDYGANVEKATSRYAPMPAVQEPRPVQFVPTPRITSVEQLAQAFPDIAPDRMVKTLLFVDTVSDEMVALCIRGDLSVSERRLENASGRSLVAATHEEILHRTGAPVGFAGPIDLRGVKTVLFDRSVQGLTNFLCGVNRRDVHAIDVNFGADLPHPEAYVDVHRAEGGHGCPACDGTLVERRGIELGHVFQLQQKKYAEPLGATFRTATGEDDAMWMGCYGIGTTRLLQALAECRHDDDGLVWSSATTPYHVHIVQTRSDDDAIDRATERLVTEMRAQGLTTMVDDRDAGAGAKFKDADLLGFPVRVTVGRGAVDGLVEVRDRASGVSSELPVEAAAQSAVELLAGEPQPVRG